MPIHFPEEELASRRKAAAAAVVARGLDGLLMFRQESMYYLTGYETFGFSMFQCLVLRPDAQVTLLTRLPDLRQAKYTSDITDIRLWKDEAGMNPAKDLRALLAELGLSGKRLGIEWDSYGLKAYYWRLMESELGDFCRFEDASELVSGLRAVKSQRELEYTRRAAALADDALDEAIRLALPGAFEGEILAAMQGAVFRGDGDYCGNEFIIGSGPAALLVRYHSGRRHLSAQDQLTLEFGGAYRRYHACMMRTILIGRPDPRHVDMHKACRDAMHACMDAVRRDRTMGDVFDAHARVLDAAGYHAHRFHACGYGMGAVFNPLWVDPPMFYAGNPLIIAPNMAFFLHMILVNNDAGLAMTLGHAVIVTDTGCEPISRHSLDLIATTP